MILVRFILEKRPILAYNLYVSINTNMLKNA